MNVWCGCTVYQTSKIRGLGASKKKKYGFLCPVSALAKAFWAVVEAKESGEASENRGKVCVRLLLPPHLHFLRPLSLPPLATIELQGSRGLEPPSPPPPHPDPPFKVLCFSKSRYYKKFLTQKMTSWSPKQLIFHGTIPKAEDRHNRISGGQ